MPLLHQNKVLVLESYNLRKLRVVNPVVIKELNGRLFLNQPARHVGEVDMVLKCNILAPISVSTHAAPVWKCSIAWLYASSTFLLLTGLLFVKVTSPSVQYI